MFADPITNNVSRVLTPTENILDMHNAPQEVTSNVDELIAESGIKPKVCLGCYSDTKDKGNELIFHVLYTHP